MSSRSRPVGTPTSSRSAHGPSGRQQGFGVLEIRPQPNLRRIIGLLPRRQPRRDPQRLRVAFGAGVPPHRRQKSDGCAVISQWSGVPETKRRADTLTFPLAGTTSGYSEPPPIITPTWSKQLTPTRAL